MLKRIIGLTGGIGTGKTTVSRYLAQKYHIPILDADLYAREAVQLDSPILNSIYQRYGNSLQLADGSLNRSALGDIIFNQPSEKAWLESQIHPYVRNKFQSALKSLNNPIIVLVIPLLFEAQMTDLVTEIWVVSCAETEQINRIQARDQITTQQAIARIHSQFPLATKIKQADIVLDNTTTPEALYQQIDLAMSTAKSLRIVSLLPSATEIVASLGLINALVGCSHECDYPLQVKQLPICTKARINSDQPSKQIDTDVKSLFNSALSIYDLELETLQQLQPTHIITQDQCELCAVSFTEVEAAVKELLPTPPQIISLQPNELSQVWQDIQRVGDVLGVNSQPVLDSLLSRIEAISSYSQNLTPAEIPRVLAIEWIDPLMVGGNWIHELIELAGGKPLFSEKGQPSCYLTWEELHQNQPDVIIIMPCGFDLERNFLECRILEQKPDWANLVAVANNLVFLTDGNAYFNRPGPRLVDSLEILAEILHPEQFKFGYLHQGWKLWSDRP